MSLTLWAFLRGDYSFPKTFPKVETFLTQLRSLSRDRENYPDGFVPLTEAVELFYAGSAAKNKETMFRAALLPLFDCGLLVFKRVRSEKSDKIVFEKPLRIKLDYVGLQAQGKVLGDSAEEFVTRG